MEAADLEMAVMEWIATDHQLESTALRLGDKGAVFYQQGDQLRCVCQKGSHYWNHIEAAIATARAIDRARGD